MTERPKAIARSARRRWAWGLAFAVLLVGAVATAARRATPALTVRVVAHQWYWDFEYVGLDVHTRNALHVPADRVVRLELASADVVHSLWIPGMAEALSVGPGMLQTLDLRFGPGTALGTCDATCGCGAGCMSFRVDAQPPPRFERWWRRRVGRAPRTAGAPGSAPACASPEARPKREPSNGGASWPLEPAAMCRTATTTDAAP